MPVLAGVEGGVSSACVGWSRGGSAYFWLHAIRVGAIMLIFNPVIQFCNSFHPSLLFLLHAPIIPVIIFSNQLPHEIYIQ